MIIINDKENSLASFIHDKRLEFLQNLIITNSFDLGIYAAYFEIPKSLAEKDFSLLGYDKESLRNDNPVSLNNLINERNLILSSYEKNSDDYMNKLYELGLWHEPQNDQFSSYDYTNSDYQFRFQQAISYYQKENVSKETVSKLFNINIGKFDYYARRHGIFCYHDNMLLFSEELKMLIEKSDSVTVANLTALPKSKLNLQHYPFYEHVKFTSLKNVLFRDKVWKMYNKDNMTMQEIADILNISRTTISSYISSYENEHSNPNCHYQSEISRCFRKNISSIPTAALKRGSYYRDPYLNYIDDANKDEIRNKLNGDGDFSIEDLDL